MLHRLIPLILVLSPASALTLYDGSGGQSPSAQGWVLGGFGGYTEILDGGAAILTTAASPDLNRAGYSIISPFSLDRTAGYELTFDLQLDSEAHQSNDRAGLSVVIIGNDLEGIELGFWTGGIWAQNDGATKPPRFTHGEEASHDTTRRTAYRVVMSGGNYTVYAGSTLLMSGALRNYSPEGLPYTVPNFVFVGDDTTAANATMRFYSAGVSEVPEPGSLVLTGAGLLWAARRRR